MATPLKRNPPRRLSPEEEDQICARYVRGETSCELKKAIGVSTSRISFVLKKHAVPARRGSECSMGKLDPATRQSIVRHYQNGFAIDGVAARFGIGIRLVKRLLDKSGILIRTHSEARRKYDINLHFFDSIDTEEKAYWLGFIMADGNVHGDNRFSMFVQARDGGHIRKFLRAIGSNHPLRFINSGTAGQFGVQIICPDLCLGLIRHNVTPRKSLTATPPELRSDLKRHFYRGLVDGDGYLGAIKAQRGSPVIVLAGSKKCCVGFVDFVETIINHRCSIYPQRNIFVAHVSQARHAISVMHALYDDCTIALTRKLEKAHKLCEWKYRMTNSNVRRLRKFSPSQESFIAESHLPRRAIAISVGCCVETVSRIHKRHRNRIPERIQYDQPSINL